jgi:endonuclease YncB( thermonuclease family)
LAIAGLLSLLLLLASAYWALPSATGLSGAVRIIDGDTIMLGGVRVRLEGIDAPELDQSCGGGWLSSWPCGREAAAYLAHLMSGRDVNCRAKGHDAYGRVLGVCFAAGRDINADMVESGMAWAFRRYSQSYVAAEHEARARKLGIWRGRAEPAWSYRARRWAQAVR